MSHIEEVENSSDAAEHTSKANDLPVWCHRDHWGILPSVDVIVHASADVLNLRDALNRNLLHSAAHHGNVEICGALLAHPDFKLLNDLSTRKWSAFHYAAGTEELYHSRAEICRMLIALLEFNVENSSLSEQLRIYGCNQMSRSKVIEKAKRKLPLAQAIADALTKRCHKRYRYIVSGYPDAMKICRKDLS